MDSNPLTEIAKLVLIKEEFGYKVYGILINPVTYHKYLNNPYIRGVFQDYDSFSAFPGIKRIFQNDMPLNKIVLITDENMFDFMVEK